MRSVATTLEKIFSVYRTPHMAVLVGSFSSPFFQKIGDLNPTRHICGGNVYSDVSVDCSCQVI